MKLAYQIATPDVAPSPGVTSYQNHDIAASFARLAETGYDGAELMVCDPTRVDARLVERLAGEYRLDIPMICTGEVFGQDRLSFSSPDDSVRARAIGRVKAAIDLAAVFGAAVNIGRVRGGFVRGVPRETCRQRSVDAMREISDHALPLKVTVALEPVNSLALNFVNSTREGLDMVREIGRDNFRLMLDSGHMFIEDPDIGECIRDSVGVCTHVHLSDSNRKPPGCGRLDFGKFIGLLRQHGYDGYVAVEVFQVPDQETALRESFTYLKPLVG